MRNKKAYLLSLCAAVFLANLGFGLAAGKTASSYPFLVTLPGKSHEVWNIASSGKAKRSKIMPSGMVEETMEGSTAPALSPNGKKLAYLQGNNLWIKNFPEGKPRKITQEGFGMGTPYEPVFPLISGWSQDGTQLIYFLKHAEPGEEGVEDGPALEVKPLAYGYYLYDTTTAKTTSLTLEGHYFCGWDSQNEALFQQSNGPAIVAFGLETGKREFTVQAPDTNDLGQFFMSFTGNEALALVGVTGKWSKIIRIDLAGGAVTDVSAQIEWGGLNWPSLSPSGKKTAWVQTVRDDEGAVGLFLLVDKKVTLKVKNVARYRWVDEEKIVLVDSLEPGKLELLVIQASDGKILDKHPL
jgi:hypothetical protein